MIYPFNNLILELQSSFIRIVSVACRIVWGEIEVIELRESLTWKSLFKELAQWSQREVAFVDFVWAKQYKNEYKNNTSFTKANKATYYGNVGRKVKIVNWTSCGMVLSFLLVRATLPILRVLGSRSSVILLVKGFFWSTGKMVQVHEFSRPFFLKWKK